MPVPEKRHTRRQGPGENNGPDGMDIGVLRIERFVEPCILLLLAEQDQHGYALREELTRVGLAGDIDIGYLYRRLRRMEREGLVVSDWAEQRTAPSRRLYRMTPQGRKQLDTWAASLRQTRRLISKFLRIYAAARPNI
jgi:PadR family transcriptional regulator, regulatory protein PadR